MFKLPKGVNPKPSNFAKGEAAWCSAPYINNWVLVEQPIDTDYYLVIDPVIQDVWSRYLWKIDDIVSWNNADISDLILLRHLFPCPKN